MSFSEFVTHPNRSTSLFNTIQTTQILYPQHRKKILRCKQLILTDNKNISAYLFEPVQGLQSNFITDSIRNFMTQQKQRKQLILTDNKNISTYCFQSMQRLQPNFMTDGIRNFMYTKHNRGNPKLKIFSFILQRQCIQPNFMNGSIRTFLHTK